MDVNKLISKERRKWRCKEHPSIPCELICLNGDAKQRVMCFNCVQKHQIPVQNIISMSYVLAANENDILEAYPPLQGHELFSKLRNTRLQQQLEEIEDYFKKLREDFEKEVIAAEQRAKQSLIKFMKAYHELLEGWMRIEELEKLKQLIVSEKDGAEKDLDDFVKEKWNKSEENRKVLVDLIKQHEDEQYFSPDEPNIIAQEIIQSLKGISFFQQSIPQITLIQSTSNTSQLEITKVDNSIYQVKRLENYNHKFDEVFIDPILNPLKKYILHIELEQNQGNENNKFLFGLMKDEGKDKSDGFSQSMSYYDEFNNFGITKYIKGRSMTSGKNVIGKHSFEVRIYLNQKFLRVASLPDYSSVAELNDPNKIDPKVAYRFVLSMCYQGDMMRIINMRTVREFDKKM